ncbi:MAG: Thermophilic serine proteinase precursor [Deltaproteobacteria bacterium]|nr:Thermophilic serine proteinase precursor [Deltaproteobacteria bacterium]
MLSIRTALGGLAVLVVSITFVSLAAAQVPTPTPAGPPVLAFVVVPANGCYWCADDNCNCGGVPTPTPYTGQGPQVFAWPVGSGMKLVIETNVAVPTPNPFGCAGPGLQVESTNQLGTSATALCSGGSFDSTYRGSIPAVPIPHFDSPDVVDALQSFATSFTTYTSSGWCTPDPTGFPYEGRTIASGTTLQFCTYPPAVTPYQRFPAGDTLLTARLVNAAGTPGPTKQIIVRVPTPSSTGIAGLIHYFSSPSLGVDGATVQLRSVTDGGGQTVGTDQTDTTGQFAFPGIGADNWQVQPSKTGATNNPVDVNDAVAVLEAAVNLRTLGQEQQVACDVSGNGGIDVDDAVLILEYVVGLIPQFPVAQNCNSDWAFIPEAAVVSNQEITYPQIATTSCQPNGAITYRPLAGQADNQNFSGVLFGDCLGRWQPGTAAAISVGLRGTAAVRVGQ